MSKFIKIVLAGVVLLYGWCLYIYLNTPVRTEIVKHGMLEDVENVDAYVIREEKLLYSNVAGSFDGIAREGERVAKGAKVATVYKGQVDEKIQEELKKVNERIAEVSSNQGKSSIFSKDIEKLEIQMNAKVNDIINISASGKADKLSQIKADMNKILDKMLVISGEKGASGNNLEALKKERDKYEEQIQSNKIDLSAEASGVISYNIDGMEQILNPEKINEYMPSHFANLDNIPLSNNSEVKPGQPVAKIINNFEWYVGFLIEVKKMYPLNLGDRVDIRFRDLDNTTINADIIYISPEEDGKVVVVASSNKYIESMHEIRKVDCDIIKQSYSGFKIPVSAIRVKDGKTGVYIVKERVARFREIEILYKNNDFAIIRENNMKDNSVLLYDEVIVKSNNIEDGKLIR
ncbi:HlyD family efflux transporter periplasmic adaptor subunit [Petroclostridium sp. X23]|uniref:HlyD family efflux transporter periplasmic adaptor subunit n=1 Tax=Petroclostridium sp. X23 TaxID=3045146 RepID=UPI0024ADBDCA|nr:HlyD family efflux transporter periplasmic adaptor subunit [Petroclostridium sp. X23]WHH59552.1 HlyD family efflux transporter periplasmic adaptor subunit [Petroclostridium sp. X23]